MTKFAAIELSRLARGAPDPTEAPQAALPRPHAQFVRRDYAVVNPAAASSARSSRQQQPK